MADTPQRDVPLRQEQPPRRRRALRIVLWTIVGLFVVWLGGDFIYSRVVAHRLAAWEATVERDEDGVRKGCAAYSLGAGEVAVLLVHGFGDSPAVYRQMAPALAECGFAVRAMRLPGFAMPMEQYRQTSAERWLSALADETAALRKNHRRVWIVAHSLGGAIALARLLDHPDDADGLVLAAPLVEVSDERSPILPTRAWHRLSSVLLFTSVTETPFAADVYAIDPADYPCRDRFIPRAVYDHLYDLVDRIAGRGAELRMPLLLALSPTDQVIDTDAAARFFADVPGETKRLIWLKRSGHAIPLDHDAPRLVDEIERFIRRRDLGADGQEN